jgi:hypothetical protein
MQVHAAASLRATRLRVTLLAARLIRGTIAGSFIAPKVLVFLKTAAIMAACVGA